MSFAVMLSFALAGLCTGAGLVSMKLAPSARYLPLAFIPLGFGVQQALEGVIRYQLAGGTMGPSLGGLSAVYLLLGEVLWPVLIPIVVLLIETDDVRKLILSGLLIAGVILSIGFSILLGIADYSAVLEDAGVRYLGWIEFSPDFSFYPLSRTGAWNVSGLGWTVLPYGIVTLGSAIVSSHLRIRWFGYLCAIGLIVSSLLYRNALISVWCIFASICSLMIVAQVRAARTQLK